MGRILTNKNHPQKPQEFLQLVEMMCRLGGSLIGSNLEVSIGFYRFLTSSLRSDLTFWAFLMMSMGVDVRVCHDDSLARFHHDKLWLKEDFKITLSPRIMVQWKFILPSLKLT